MSFQKLLFPGSLGAHFRLTGLCSAIALFDSILSGSWTQYLGFQLALKDFPPDSFDSIDLRSGYFLKGFRLISTTTSEANWGHLFFHRPIPPASSSIHLVNFTKIKANSEKFIHFFKIPHCLSLENQTSALLFYFSYLPSRRPLFFFMLWGILQRLLSRGRRRKC